MSHTVDGSGGFTTSITAESAEPDSKDKGADKDDDDDF
ncbi:hypothetical protein F11_10385 [Rhodospirillum rubrum F11]|nr:hypothetical protein F11_10385 [Rhodospirillum rubrum F11]